MTDFNEVKDSGERQEWDTGSQRDSQEGKGRFDLIPWLPMERLAQHFENGAKKYDDDNWKKGQNLRQYVNSMLRHALKMSEGWLDEDHAAAVMWNAAAFIWTKDAIDRGVLPAELDDIPWQATAEATETELRTFNGDLIAKHLVIDGGAGGSLAKIVIPHNDGTQTEITQDSITREWPQQSTGEGLEPKTDPAWGFKTKRQEEKFASYLALDDYAALTSSEIAAIVKTRFPAETDSASPGSV